MQMSKRALLFYGGWEGHEPTQVAGYLQTVLTEEGFEVELSDSLSVLEEVDLSRYDLIIPNWTQGTIPDQALQALMKAVEGGVGLAGLHGGMGDSFRMSTDYQSWSADSGLLIQETMGYDTPFIL